jgi:hypothetical protein
MASQIIMTALNYFSYSLFFPLQILLNSRVSPYEGRVIVMCT